MKTIFVNTVKGASAILLAASLAGCVSTAISPLGDMAAGAIGLQQNANAFPNEQQVAPGTSLPMDGVYMLGDLNKRIEMNGGRMLAIDPWTFMLTKKIIPGSVLMRDIRQVAPGQYQGFDLAWNKPVTLTESNSGNVDVRIQTLPLPVTYSLIPTGLAPDRDTQRAADPVSPAPQRSAPEPEADGLEGCDLVDIDPNTGELVCIE